MKASLQRLHSPDVWDLTEYTPEDPDYFGILVQAMIAPSDRSAISPAGGPIEESIDFVVCTISWFEKEAMNNDYKLGQGYLFVRKYSYTRLWNTIAELCDKIEGSDWEEIGSKLSRYGYWEFEDYKPRLPAK